MAIGMSELKKGLKIELGGVPYRIVEYQHVKPGKGAAFVLRENQVVFGRQGD